MDYPCGRNLLANRDRHEILFSDLETWKTAGDWDGVGFLLCTFGSSRINC